jgi:hypothetical protein
MFNSFQQRPTRQPYRHFECKPPDLGDQTYVSVNVTAPVMPVHFAKRSMPCFGPGCPLCPLPTRHNVYLPTVWHPTGKLRLLLLGANAQMLDLAANWQLGWILRTERKERKSRVVSVTQSLHAVPCVLKDTDVMESLCRMWRLPSPQDYLDEEAWIKGCLQAITRSL